MVFRLGSVLASQLVQVDAPVWRTVCRRCRGGHLSGDIAGHGVLPALGAIDLRYRFSCWIAHGPVSGASVFTIFAAVVRRPGWRIHAAANWRHCRNVFSAASA